MMSERDLSSSAEISSMASTVCLDSLIPTKTFRLPFGDLRRRSDELTEHDHQSALSWSGSTRLNDL
jgi:hypothetical protein